MKKFWVMPRTGTAISPTDSSATGVTATKGFDLARDIIGGLPELNDQIGGAMVGTSGQARAERVATEVRDLQPFDVEFRDNRDPYAAEPARVGAGTVFSATVMAARGDNDAPWRVEVEYATGNFASFDVQFGMRKIMPQMKMISLSFLPTGEVTYV